MRIAVISDIHSNLEALTSVLREVDARRDEVLCLGDIVGYGADPSACIDLVRSRCMTCVMGNHDDAVATLTGLDALPPDGRTAAIHNRSQLRPDEIDFLTKLPLKAETDGCTLVHATPQEPGAWRRIDGFASTRVQFEHFETDVCFIGDTHIAGIVADRLGVWSVRRGHRYIINAGSVGQPRDRDPRASFALFDTDAFSCEIVRVAYDVNRAAGRIRKAGLPDRLADRLFEGV
jgi:diadenosine tetraphosphatase ApaH/serine/threonine PP2A family protein phosphatase